MRIQLLFRNPEIAFEMFSIMYYYMAVSPKDWELPNSRIWIGSEIDIDRGLDFPISGMASRPVQLLNLPRLKKNKNEKKNIDSFR